MTDEAVSPSVLYRTDGPVATITINRPDRRNAINPEVTTVVLRKGYGAGYNVMNGRAYEPDVIGAWPMAEISPYVATGWAFLDDVVDPADTRTIIARGLEQTVDKHIDRPWRKHGVLPV